MIKLFKLQTGFTLLEIVVSMAIVALVVGTLFGLLASSKKLAFKATDEIGEILFLRAAINSSQLLEKLEYPKFPEENANRTELERGDVLEPPDYLKGQIRLGLESYTLKDTTKGTEYSGLRLRVLKPGE